MRDQKVVDVDGGRGSVDGSGPCIMARTQLFKVRRL